MNTCVMSNKPDISMVGMRCKTPKVNHPCQQHVVQLNMPLLVFRAIALQGCQPNLR